MTEVKTKPGTKPGTSMGKVYYCGELVFSGGYVSVSSGQGDEYTDSLAYRDSSDRLMIPATSFAGVLNHKLENRYGEKKECIDRLFGNIYKDETLNRCSDIVFTDLYPVEKNEPGEGETGRAP